MQFAPWGVAAPAFQVSLLCFDYVLSDDVGHLRWTLWHLLGLLIGVPYFLMRFLLLSWDLLCLLSEMMGVVGEFRLDQGLILYVAVDGPIARRFQLTQLLLLLFLFAEVRFGTISHLHSPQMGMVVGCLSELNIAFVQHHIIIVTIYSLHFSLGQLLIRIIICWRLLYPINTLLLGVLDIRKGWLCIFICQFFLLPGLSLLTDGDIVGKLLHKLDQLIHGLRALWFQVFAFLHTSHLLVQFQYKGDEFLLIRWLVLIKFDYPPLQDVQQRVDAAVVGLFLEASCEARVNGHLIKNYKGQGARGRGQGQGDWGTRSEHAALVGGDHVLDVDVGILAAVLLQNLQGLLDQF